VTHFLENDERTLALAARAGDRVAFGLLVQRHHSLLLALCRHLLRDPNLAEDAAQEAALRALLSLETLRRPERFGPWLAGIGLNVCRQWLRARARPAEPWSWEALVGGACVDEPWDQTASINPERAAEERDLAVAVRMAVASLPAGQQAAVLLFYLSGLTYAETAAALGVPAGAVKTRLHKARAALRVALWARWHEVEDQMTTTGQSREPGIEARVWDVRRTPETPEQASRTIVLLEEVAGTRVVPIWIGPLEGDAITLLVEGVETVRPLTHTFAARLLEAAGGRIREVRISRVTADDGVIYAEALVDGPVGQQVVDCRPSDALALALALGATVTVSPEAMASMAEPRERFVDVPDGVLTARVGAQRWQEQQAKSQVEWRKAEAERRARRGG
jgi:RNA polymerase sigma factor (sigma-70 family)